MPPAARNGQRSAGTTSPDGHGEGQRGRRVPGGERRRRGHRHPTRLGHLVPGPVGAGPVAGQLHRLVDDERRCADGGDTGERGPAPGGPAERREQPGHEEPRLGVVGEVRQPAQRHVEERRRQPGHGHVGGAVEGPEAVQQHRRSGRPRGAPPPPRARRAGGRAAPRRLDPGVARVARVARRARATGSATSPLMPPAPAARGRSATARRGSRSTRRARPGRPCDARAPHGAVAPSGHRAGSRTAAAAPAAGPRRRRRPRPAHRSVTSNSVAVHSSQPENRATCPAASSAASFSASAAPRTRTDTTPSRPLSIRGRVAPPRRCEQLVGVVGHQHQVGRRSLAPPRAA